MFIKLGATTKRGNKTKMLTEVYVSFSMINLSFLQIKHFPNFLLISMYGKYSIMWRHQLLRVRQFLQASANPGSLCCITVQIQVTAFVVKFRQACWSVSASSYRELTDTLDKVEKIYIVTVQCLSNGTV